MKKAAISALLLIFSNFPVVAQDWMGFHAEVFVVLEEKLLPRLIDMMPIYEKNKVEDIDLVFFDDPTEVSVVMTEEHTKKVYFFAGFMDGLYQYIDCVLLHWYQAERVPCYVYFDYYFGHILSRKPRRPLSYGDAAFVDQEMVSFWYNEERLVSARNTMFVSALILITMHELGHHVVGFSRPGMTVYEHRKLEERVDRWAIDRLAQMGEGPMLGATVALGYIAEIERYRRARGATSFSSHPMPRERAEYAYDVGCADSTDALITKACEMLGAVIDTFE